MFTKLLKPVFCVLLGLAICVPGPVAGALVTPQISASHLHSLALKADGTVWGWGDNSLSPVSDGGFIVYLTPVHAFGLTDMIQISAGRFTSLALKADGTVWQWGMSYGSSGTGFPVQVTGLSGVIQIETGYECYFALKSDGTVWAWGENDYGQLGDGTTAGRATPAQVSGLTGVSRIFTSGSSTHVFALKNDGTAWGWGNNQVGQLGSGTTISPSTPVRLDALAGITRFAMGNAHSLALQDDGTVLVWGYNRVGQVGDGTTNDRLIPAPVAGLSGIVQIQAGPENSLALKNDGNLWAWGSNIGGQLGDGTTTNRLVPVQTLALSQVHQPASGWSHSLVLKNDGTVWGWGSGGRLGDGTETASTTPVQTQIHLGSFMLTVVKSGSGTVTGSLPGIDCGSDCSEEYLPLLDVALTATPTAGYVFGGWSGGCSGAAETVTVTMDAAKTCTAHFNPILTVNVVSGKGTITSTPGSIDCGTDCSGDFGFGSTVTLTATPETGYKFSQWSGDCSGTNPTITVTMDATKICSATFAPCAYTLSPTNNTHTANYETGTVTVTASHTSCPWTAVSHANWATIAIGSTGTGNGTVTYTVAANSGAERSTNLSIAGQTFTLTQAAAQSACTYTLAPASAAYSAEGGNGTVSVNSAPGCAWNAAATVSWLQVTAGSSGTGSGTVQYRVAANSDPTPRNGTLEIADYVLPVTQAGAADCLSITPSNYDFGDTVPGQQSAEKIFHVTNSCQSAVSISGVAVFGVGEFNLSNDGCGSRTLAYQQNCTVGVRFQPSAEGTQNAFLNVLYGTGKTATAAINGASKSLPPVACIKEPIVTNGLSASPDGSCSTDSNGTIEKYDWQVNCTNNAAQSHANGNVTESFQFTAPGTCTATLTVTDNDGFSNTTSKEFVIGYAIRTTNLSVRCHIQPGPKAAVAGFIIKGTGTKKILLRALAAASLSPGLDLRLSLYKLRNGTWDEILNNDNWASGSRAVEIAGLAANLVPAGSMDAALLVDLEPGTYTAIATPNSDSGIGVVGVDDLDGDNPSSRLINISGRCAVEDGNGNAIAGFIVTGSGTLKTLLRGLRVNDELSGTLDPRLELVRIYPGNPVADVVEGNDNCADHPRIAEISALASNLRPVDHRNACILIDLEPGVYTVLMKPNGAHGVGVVGVDTLE